MSEKAVLVKFAQHEHIAALQKEGLIYMNNLPFFWEIEDKHRRDCFDGVLKIARGKDAELRTMDGKKLPIETKSWELRFQPTNPEKINIFCMNAVRPSVGSFPVDERNFEFGGSALVITNVPAFIDRISTYVKQNKISGQSDLVTYVDDCYAGEVGPFKKLRRFNYQSEWRLVCEDGPSGPRIIHLGNLQDISIVVPSIETNQILEDLLS